METKKYIGIVELIVLHNQIKNIIKKKKRPLECTVIKTKCGAGIMEKNVPILDSHQHQFRTIKIVIMMYLNIAIGLLIHQKAKPIQPIRGTENNEQKHIQDIAFPIP